MQLLFSCTKISKVPFKNHYSTLSTFSRLAKSPRLAKRSVIMQSPKKPHLYSKFFFCFFLTNITQHVNYKIIQFNKAISDPQVISSRAPKGVWAPKFSLHCAQIVVWAKPLTHQNISSYHSNSLYSGVMPTTLLWMKKTEMIFDLKLIGDHSPLFIHNVPIK